MAYYQAVLSRALQLGVPVADILLKPEHNPKRMTDDEFVAIRRLNAALRY
ncbi:hypothetical protein HYV72_01450 [Candidatus Uhrbacteria bacterium]|nr:hypothetical protein [Candidatus Uhrbacteria bacterium]